MKPIRNMILLMYVIIVSSMNCFAGEVSASANQMTNMVKNIIGRVLTLRNSSASIDPSENEEGVGEIVQGIEDLSPLVENLYAFVKAEKRKDPDFINKLNDEGMPPRIIEEELEVTFRHDLDAIGLSLGLGTSAENYDLWKLTTDEEKVYDTIENLSGPTLTFKNLATRYNKYRTFVPENKRLTQQEAHVILHITAYVLRVGEAIDLAQKDAGRYLCNLLKTYVDWLPYATHLDEDVEVIKAHGSIMSVVDKNNKTMLAWTYDLINRVKAMRETLQKKGVATNYMDESLKYLNDMTMMLKGTIRTEKGELKKITTRSPLRTEKSQEEYSRSSFARPLTAEEEKTIRRLKALNLETKKELIDASDAAQISFPRTK